MTIYEKAQICAAQPFRSNGAYVISGGLGGLGLVAAKHILTHGGSTVVLLSRSGYVAYEAAELWEEITAMQECTVLVMRCDVAVRQQVDQLFTELAERGIAVHGILHAAGVLADGMLVNQLPDNFSKVCDPKVTGGWNLHHATLQQEGCMMLMYSSIAASLGSPGQSNYSYANGWLA